MADEPTPAEDEQSASEEVCATTAPTADLVVEDPELVYEPRVLERPGDFFEVAAKRENPDVTPWGFWGGVLVAVVAGFVLFSGAVSGPAVRFPIEHVLVVGVLTIAGLALFRLGRRSTLEEMALCEIDLREGIVSWPVLDDGRVVAVAFEDVVEVTFAIVDAPASKSSSGARLDAATVRVRDVRGREIPVVDASTSKGDTHLVARWLAELFDMSVNYEGTGVEEWV